MTNPSIEISKGMITIKLPLLEEPYETPKFVMLGKTRRFEPSSLEMDGMPVECQVLVGARKVPRKAPRALPERPAYAGAVKFS